VVNKYSLGRHLTGFFILNEDLLLKSGKLTTVGLKAINIKIVRKRKSSAFAL